LSGRGLCDGLITRPEESYRLWCVVVCDLETSMMMRPWPLGGGLSRQKQKKNTILLCWWLGSVITVQCMQCARARVCMAWLAVPLKHASLGGV